MEEDAPEGSSDLPTASEDVMEDETAESTGQESESVKGKEKTPEEFPANRLDNMERMLHELREELYELKDSMEKSVDGNDKTQNISQTAMVSTVQPKGINAPGGMSTEQLQEFKKQTLQINGLQQKMKDLELKLNEAAAAIKKGNERSGEMEEKSIENVKDLYGTIDEINNSLSEKIAQQRVEMQKIAGDTPKAINYDPFNYGEAYGGDFVDFQARKRITKIKLLLHSLQAAMNTLRESAKVSPEVDLGFKVVRLDQLLAATGFRDAITTGESSNEDAVIISQRASREPGRIEMPRKEMFQTSEDLESKWAITDSIMQTMYRLEMELGELQKAVCSSDVSSNTKILDDLVAAIKQLKDRQLDIKTVKRLIEENSSGVPVTKVRQPSIEFTRFPMTTTNSHDGMVTRSMLDDSFRPLKSMQTTIESLVKRIKELEVFFEARPKSAVRKTKQGSVKAACLSCDRALDGKVVNQQVVTKYNIQGSLYDATKTAAMQVFVKTPKSLQYTINRSYTIDTSTGVLDVYSIPRPCGAGYAVYWPVHRESKQQLTQAKYTQETDTKLKYIRGLDGHYYMGSDVPVLMAVITESPHENKGNRSSIRKSVTVDMGNVEEMPEIQEQLVESNDGAVQVVIDKDEDEEDGEQPLPPPPPPQEEFDNSEFFAGDNESQNAENDFTNATVLRLNNNNNCSDDKPHLCRFQYSTFTNIIELVTTTHSCLLELNSVFNCLSMQAMSISLAQM